MTVGLVAKCDTGGGASADSVCSIPVGINIVCYIPCTTLVKACGRCSNGDGMARGLIQRVCCAPTSGNSSVSSGWTSPAAQHPAHMVVFRVTADPCFILPKVGASGLSWAQLPTL